MKIIQPRLVLLLWMPLAMLVPAWSPPPVPLRRQGHTALCAETELERLAREWQNANRNVDEIPATAASSQISNYQTPVFREAATRPPVAPPSPPLASTTGSRTPPSPPSNPATNNALYEGRTQFVAASVKAGKSRWGTMENQLCSLLASHWNPAKFSPDDWQAQQQQQQQQAPSSTSSSTNAELYDQRTQQVAAAVKAGKSRWGVMENQRATMIVQGETTTMQQTAPSTQVPSSSNSLYDQRSQKVSATAKVGKSRWGSMENDRASVAGSSSARPKGGTTPPPMPRGSSSRSSAPSSTAASISSKGLNSRPRPTPPSPLYQKRSQQVVEAAAAGKSRWGTMHVEKVNNAVGLQQALTTLSHGVPEASPLPTPPSPSVPLSSSAGTTSRSLFDQRNAKVIAAAEAGLSRWGTMENEKAKMSWGLKQALDRIGEGIGNIAEQVIGGGGTPKGSSSSSTETSLYDVRSQKVAEAAAAGKSRWGNMHVEKVSNVAGLKQARVSLEGGIPPATNVPPPPPVSPIATPTQSKGSLYDQRNEKLAAAADKGRSRWGTMETEKAAMSAGLKQAFDFLGGKPVEPISSPSTTPPADRTKVEPVDSIMAQITQEWQAANKDFGASPSLESKTTPPPPPSPPVESSTSSMTMDQLAREWAAMNSAHDSRVSAPSFDMSGISQTVSQPPPPPSPPAASMTPSFPAVPPTPIPMPPPQGAAQNEAVATAAPPPQAAAVETAAAAYGMQNDWERLAREWMQTNSDKDA